MTLCETTNCSRPVEIVNRNLCRPCYARWWRTGSTAEFPTYSPAERFWAKVQKTDTCWLWTGSRNEHGYGKFRLQGKGVTASRFSYYLAHGKWPNPCCLHSCDNPPCVNPAHLREGTQKDNSIDKINRGRVKTHNLFGDAMPAAKLTNADIPKIRELLSKNIHVNVIAKQFGICRATVYNIRNGKSWGRV